MRRPISPLVHGFIDYGYAAVTLGGPRTLGWSRRATRTLAAASAATLGYSLLTRYPLGLLKLLPLRVHLTLDVALSLALFAAQFEETEEESSVRLAFVGLAALGLLVSALTRTSQEGACVGDD
jgi:hypothetical protein